jgi:hypothetical protein
VEVSEAPRHSRPTPLRTRATVSSDRLTKSRVAHHRVDTNNRNGVASEVGLSVGSLWRMLYWQARTPWPGYGLPFNGQSHRAAVVEALIADFRPDLLVETGTLLGHTTRRLAELGPPVRSVEVHPGFYRLARLRLGATSNVEVIRGDSAEALDLLRRQTTYRSLFAYLDAHWYGRLPLAEEVALILDSWEETLIVIDDCRVPHDPGYGYDIYEGVAVGIELLDLPAQTLGAYPSTPAVQETGGRRGTLYLAQGRRARESLGNRIEQGALRPTDVPVPETSSS